MEIENDYERWKAITESDFVTLFIKTWFTYIAVLRELNPSVSVFTKEGLPRGDKPFLNAFKEGIMPIVQKNLDIDSAAQELFSMYSISMKKIMNVFPQYFFQTFFRVNESFHYSDESMEKNSEGKIKERYKADIQIVGRYHLKMYLGISGCFRSTNYNENIKHEIDLRCMIESTVSKHRVFNQAINETQFLRDFYDGVLSEIDDFLRMYMNETLPQKKYNQTISSKIKEACLRLHSALRMKFEYNYKYNHEVGILDDPNSYVIIFQLPFYQFGRLDHVYKTYEGYYSQLIVTKGIDWFAGYVYALRNALFHEIISPLDEEWQVIFKSAYLILKQITDICISYAAKIIDFPEMRENAVFNYADKHQDRIFSDLADSVELLSFSKMSLKEWKIEQGQIMMAGWFCAKFKLQMGTAEDYAVGNGIIEEQDKSFDFSVTLNDDFSIAFDNKMQTDLITIKLQGT